MFDGQTFAEDINAKQSGIMQNLFEDQQAQLEHEVSACVSGWHTLTV